MVEIMESKVRIEDLEKLVDLQKADGNWNYDPYMHGMANGMIFMLSCIKGGEPKYLDAPKEWLCNKSIDGEPTAEPK